MDLTLILNRRYPNSQWSLNGDDYSGLEWLSDSTKPSQEELESQWDSVLTEVLAEREAKVTQKQNLLARLGITEEEARLLLS